VERELLVETVAELVTSGLTRKSDR
jgi:hypothetical protein